MTDDLKSKLSEDTQDDDTSMVENQGQASLESEPKGDETQNEEQTAKTTSVPVDPLAESERQRDEYREQLLRKTAEFDNYRKRVDRERRDLANYAAIDLLEQLLPSIDGLERALQVDTKLGKVETYRDGIELIHRQLMELLQKHQVTPLETAGVDFDPHFHEAVAHETSADHRDGEIIEELRRGYLLGDRLLRPAMVKVAKRE